MQVPEAEHRRQLDDLEFFQGILEQIGFETQLVPHGDMAPLSYLSVAVPRDLVSEAATIQLMFIPMGKMTGNIKLLQIFGYVTGSLKELRPVVREFMDFLQVRNPVGYFGATSENQVFYRYVYTFPSYNTPDEPAFLDVMDLFLRTFSNFGETLKELHRGNIDFDTARRRISG